MKLLFNTKNTTKPTENSLVTYTQKKFQKIAKLIPMRGEEYQPTLQVDAEFNPKKKIFAAKFILRVHDQTYVFSLSDEDIRKIIDIAVTNIRRQLLKYRDIQYLNTHH